MPEAAGTDRDAKIELLLLAGLDHYFDGQYEQAINVWTRALFVDRGHARARAYIDRARSALAERQRESEELMQSGVAALDRGDGVEAQRLLQSAMRQGAPADVVLALLERLHRLNPGGAAPAPRPARERPELQIDSSQRRSRALAGRWWAAAALLLVIAGAVAVAVTTARAGLPARAEAPTPLSGAAPVPAEAPLPVLTRGEIALGRARALAGGGRLRDALSALDAIELPDARRPEAE